MLKIIKFPFVALKKEKYGSSQVWVCYDFISFPISYYKEHWR